MRVLYIVNYIYKSVICVKQKLLNYINTKIFRLRLLLNNVIYGTSVHSYGSASVDLHISRSAKSVRIGDNVCFNNNNDIGWYSRCSLWVKGNASIRIGNNVGFNGALIYASESIEIGDNVKVGGGVRIFDCDFHPLDYTTRRIYGQTGKSLPIVIRSDVFIGAGSFILKGVTIGERSIIAAGSVVVKSIPADQVWGGNPAKFIRNINGSN